MQNPAASINHMFLASALLKPCTSPCTGTGTHASISTHFSSWLSLRAGWQRMGTSCFQAL